MVDYGIKISDAGFDVLTAADKNLVMKTDITLFKEVLSGTITLSSTWNEVSHNLNYIPQYLVFTKHNSTSKVYLATAHLSYAVARVDLTKLYIKQMDTSSDVAQYYIFYEQA
jgi:hypothetical protein